MYMYMYMYMYICTYVYMHIHIYMYTYKYISIYVYIYNMCICIYIYMSICTVVANMDAMAHAPRIQAFQDDLNMPILPGASGVTHRPHMLPERTCHVEPACPESHIHMYTPEYSPI